MPKSHQPKDRPPNVTVRDALESDVPAIIDIYNAMIRGTTVAWTETLQRPAERAEWLRRQHRENFPVIVAADRDSEQVIGFASYGHFRGAGLWPGYRFTVEHSIHVREQTRGRGVGRLLLEALIERAQDAGLHVMVGAIDGENEASLRFHRRMGFREVGRMPQVGWKFGRWLDLVLVQRILE